jgi:hypothetical protein
VLRRIRRLPSPALVISLIALFVAIGGIGWAAAKIGTSDIKNGAVTTKKLHNNAVSTKKIKNNAVTGAKAKESSFGTVPNADHANNADTVGGKSPTDLQTSSAFNQNQVVISSLGGNFVDVASATITTHSAGRVLATGSAELFGNGNGNTGQCRIAIDNVPSLHYEGDNDDIGADQQYVIAVNFARDLPAGTHTAALQCRAFTGTVGKDDAGINVYGLGS